MFQNILRDLCLFKMKNIVKFTYQFIEVNPQNGHFICEFQVELTNKGFLQKKIKDKIREIEKNKKPIIIQKIWLETILVKNLSGILSEN